MVHGRWSMVVYGVLTLTRGGHLKWLETRTHGETLTIDYGSWTMDLFD